MSSSTSATGYVRAGSFCTLGDSGQTEAGTPMRCTETGDGKRARWRKAAGAVSASRIRKREPRTPRERAADKLRPSELNYLRNAAGLPYEGALPRRKSQKTKLETAGFTDPDGNITDAGRDALRRRGALDDKLKTTTTNTEPADQPDSGAPVDDLAKVAAARERQTRIDTARAAAKVAAAEDESRFDEGNPSTSPQWDQAEKVGATRVGTAGDVEAFDPARHEVLGERPAPGGDVTILRPGSRWTGDDPVFMEKPLVVAGLVDQPVVLETRDPDRPVTVTPDIRRIRDAYTRLVGNPGDWVEMADLRDAVPDMPRDDFNAAMKKLAQVKDTTVEEQVNQKILTERDRAAAFRLGGRDLHQVSMSPRSPR